jgi:hypothetical protein
MGEKGDIGKFKQAGGVVRHDVDGTRQIENRTVVTVESLVKGLEPE